MSSSDNSTTVIRHFEYRPHRLIHPELNGEYFVETEGLETLISDPENFFMNVVIVFGGANNTAKTMLQVSCCSPLGLHNLATALAKSSSDWKEPYSGMHHIFMRRFNQKRFEDYIGHCFDAVNL